MSRRLSTQRLTRRHSLAAVAVALVVATGVVTASSASSASSSQADRLRSIETTRLQALVDADTATARKLTAPDFQLINPAGAPLSRDDFLGGVQAGVIDFLALEPQLADRGPAVRRLGHPALPDEVRRRRRRHPRHPRRHGPPRSTSAAADAGRSSGRRPPPSPTGSTCSSSRSSRSADVRAARPQAMRKADAGDDRDPEAVRAVARHLLIDRCDLGVGNVPELERDPRAPGRFRLRHRRRHATLRRRARDLHAPRCHLRDGDRGSPRPQRPTEAGSSSTEPGSTKRCEGEDESPAPPTTTSTSSAAPTTGRCAADDRASTFGSRNHDPEIPQ